MRERIEKEMCVGNTWILLGSDIPDVTASTECWVDYKGRQPEGPGKAREGEVGCCGIGSPGSAFFIGI